MHCKDVRKFSAADNSSDQFGQLTVSTIYKGPTSWFLCYDDIDYLENIMHFLHLNLSFVQPNHDFDVSLFRWDFGLV